MDTLNKDFLNPADWSLLCTIKNFLRPFHSVTMKLQGYSLSLSEVLFTMDVLIKHIEIQQALAGIRLNQDLKHHIKQAWEKFNEYYTKTDSSPLYAIALIL